MATPRPRLRHLVAASLLVLPTVLVSGCQGEAPTPGSSPRAGQSAGGLSLPERTPLQEAGFETLTPHDELVSFLEALDRGSSRVTLREMGTSVGGRSLPYLEASLGTFGEPREDRLIVFIYAQQHGNEPSGKEGALALALELARGDHDGLLAEVDVILVPQVNPDGSEVHRRANDEGVDLNRSHLALDGPEVVALRELFHRWEPEVAVDVHEYYPWSGAWLSEGWLRLWDVQVGLPTNPNTHPGIRSLAEGAGLARVVGALEDHGFTGHNYVVGSPELLRWSTTNPNDGRQSLALLHTLSFIFEGRRSEPLATDMERRSEAQRVAQEALLRFTAEEAAEIRRVVHGARDQARRGEIERVVLTMGRERGDGPLRIPVESVTSREGHEATASSAVEDAWVVGATVTAVVENWFPDVVELTSTSLPAAYLVPASETVLLDLLLRHHVEVHLLEREEALDVERLRITGFRQEMLESEQEIAQVATVSEPYRTRNGDVLVRTDQLRGVLVAVLLEPGSMHGVLTLPAFRHLAEEGSYPVRRVPTLGPR
ncbi:hypothetical protein BH23GEM11_BH23GEM11_13420 [soil metagenome]